MRRCFLFSSLMSATALLGGCAAQPPSSGLTPDKTPPVTASAAPRDAVKAAAIERVLASEHRGAESRARDPYRHPLETLLFFGIETDMTVIEVWPGAGGWYTEILAPLLMERGKLYVAMTPPVAGNEYVTASLASFEQKLAARLDLYGKVEVTRLGPGNFDIGPPGGADAVVTFRNLHNWMSLGFEKEALAEMYRALKPGGILGVVDHRGDPTKPQDPRAASGYVAEEFAISLIRGAGFELVSRSEINANPKDTKDHPQGVWTLPPNYRLGSRDREKYATIGESDRFTLKFRKP
jgi:predicted methyltransferase